MARATTKILIIGGGFGGLFSALELAGTGEVTLISDEDHFLFKPMIYEYLSGEVDAWHIAPDCKELLDERVHFVRGIVTTIDLKARAVTVADRAEPISYDVLVLALGGVTNFAGVEGAEQYAFPFRRLVDANHLRRRMTEALDRVQPDAAPQDARSALTFAVVGGGASGVELSTKMADLLQDALRRRALQGEPRVLVIELTDHVVPGMGEEIRKFTEVATAAVVWVAGVRVNPLVEQLEIEKDRRGLIMVEPTLQVRGHENVFALGDIAFYKDVVPTLAGTAQLAFQQSGLLAANVRRFIEGRKLKSKHFVELGEAVSLGTERAAVLSAGKVISGPLARQARFALYTQRLPTWHHRLRVGASWFFEGTAPRPLQPLGF